MSRNSSSNPDVARESCWTDREPLRYLRPFATISQGHTRARPSTGTTTSQHVSAMIRFWLNRLGVEDPWRWSGVMGSTLSSRQRPAWPSVLLLGALMWLRVLPLRVALLRRTRIFAMCVMTAALIFFSATQL